MVRRSSEQKVTLNEHMRGGSKTVRLETILNGEEELYGKGRLFSKITLEPGASIGPHVHEGEMECFYIIKGTCDFDDNGTETVLHPGDTALTTSGQQHSIANNTEETAELVALILYK